MRDSGGIFAVDSRGQPTLIKFTYCRGTKCDNLTPDVFTEKFNEQEQKIKLVHVDLALEPGNFVFNQDALLMSEKVLSDNKRENETLEETKTRIVQQMKNLFGFKEVLFLQVSSSVLHRHVDWHMQFINDKTLVMGVSNSREPAALYRVAASLGERVIL